MVAELDQAVADHPDIVAKFSIGTSYQGRELWAAKISDNVATDEDEPEVLFDGLHHAREHLTVEQSLADPALDDRWLRRRSARHAARRPPRDLHRVHGQSRRRRVRPDGQPVPGVAQEPPAECRHDRDRHRPQPQLRLPLGLLWRLVGLAVGADLSRPEGVLGARDAGDARLHQQPGDRWPPADHGRGHLPRRGRGDPVAVRLHGDRRPVRHDRRRPGGPQGARPAHGEQERLRRQAVELAVRHRRRPDRLRLRPTPDLHVHVRAVSLEGQGQLDRPLLPARRGHRPRDRAEPGRDPVPHGAGRLPVRDHRQDPDPLRPAVRGLRDLAAAGRSIRSGPTPTGAVHGSAATRRRPRTRPGPCRRVATRS